MSELYEEPENNAEEQYCHLALAELRKSYELAAKPYIDRLVAIKSLRMPTIRLSLDQAQELQIGGIRTGNNTMLEVAEHREAELRAENKRLREALEARRDWFAAQLKSASKGNFSEWDRHALQIELDAANEALS